MLRIYFILIFSCFSSLFYGQTRDAELLRCETEISVKNNKLYKTSRFEIRINNRSGEKYNNISIPYSKIIHISNIDAYITDKNGIKIRSLRNNEITTRNAYSDISFYQDVFVKEFSLKNNVYPYKLYFSYDEVQDEFVLLDYWQPVLNYKVPTIEAKLSVTVPLEYKVSYINQSVQEPQTDTIDSQIKYTWSASYVNLLKPEIFSPPFETLLPSVIVAPEEFKYKKAGSQRSWKDFGNWYWEIIKDLSDLPSSEKSAINSELEGIQDTREKVQKLYNYLQGRVRYIDISIKTGGLVPYPASYVAQNKYGDCKALSNYFRAVLDYAGIKSFYCLVNAGDEIVPIIKSFPYQQFNHVILCVPVNKDSLWIDCTSKLAFNYQGTFIQNHDAFLIENNNSRISHLPAMQPDDVTESGNFHFSPNMSGSTDCTMRFIFKGEKYELFYSLIHDYNESQKSLSLSNFLGSKGIEVTSYNLNDPGKDSKKIILSCKGKFNSLYKTYGSNQLIGIPSLNVPLFEEPLIRKLPVQIDFPIHKKDTMEFELTDGYHLASLPKNISISNDFGIYKIDFKNDARIVYVIRDFILFAGNYKIERYNEFYKFIESIKESDRTSQIETSKKL